MLCRLKLGDLWSLFLAFVAYYIAVFMVNGQQISILMLIYFLQDSYIPLWAPWFVKHNAYCSKYVRLYSPECIILI
jgi:hypothetical protein